MSFLGDLLTGIIGSFLASQLDAWCVRWSELLVRSTAKGMPPALGVRFEEEWLAELSHQSGSVAKIRYAASLWIAQREFPERVAERDVAPLPPLQRFALRLMALSVAVASGLIVTLTSIDLTPWLEKHVDPAKKAEVLPRYFQFQDWTRTHLFNRPPLDHSGYSDILNRPIVQNPIAQNPIPLNPHSDVIVAIGSVVIFAGLALMIFFDRERESSRLIELGDLRRP